MCKRVSRFDFAKPKSTEWFCYHRPLMGQIFFEATVSTIAFSGFMMIFTSALNIMFRNSIAKYPWFDRELHNVYNNKTKAHKYWKEFETFHVCPMSESDQCLYETAFRHFWELIRRDFKSLHRITPSTSCLLRVVWKIILEDFSSMPSWCVTQAAIRRLCFWETIVPGTHRALQIYLLGFFQNVYGRDDWYLDRTCQLLTMVSFLTCLVVSFLPFGRSLLFFLYSRAAISVMCPVIMEYQSCWPF
jgi:hypothetical protein